MTDELTIIPGKPLQGVLRVPGDKSVSHRALLMAATAAGTSEIEGLSDGEDVARTAKAIAATGAAVSNEGNVVVVEGCDPREPDFPLDLGNSGTAMRLMAGWCAGIDGLSILYGDRWLTRRPMRRVVDPLRQMGARIDGRAYASFPPLVVRGGDLTGIDYRLPVPSAQVKSAVLLAGLRANGPTTVRETAPSRAHTEEMLADFGARIEQDPSGASVTVWPSSLRPTRVLVPGDPSQAAFWIVAACIVPGSDVTVEDVYIGRARAGFIDVLRRMGADLTTTARSATTADVRVRASDLHATTIAGDEVSGLIDEIPILCVAAALADGVTEVRDAAELAVKETNRIETTAAALKAFGARVDMLADGLVVHGRSALVGTTVDSHGDHRIAMSAAVAALAARGQSTVRGWSAVATSYPAFADHIQELQR